MTATATAATVEFLVGPTPRSEWVALVTCPGDTEPTVVRSRHRIPPLRVCGTHGRGATCQHVKATLAALTRLSRPQNPQQAQPNNPQEKDEK